MTDHREDSLTIELSGDEALVLFEWLSNRVGKDSFEDFDDESEQQVLWKLKATSSVIWSRLFARTITLF